MDTINEIKLSPIKEKLKAKYENLEDQIIHTPCTLSEDDPDYFVEIEGIWEKKREIFFPNRNISTKAIADEKELPDGRIVIDTQVQERGMSEDKMIAHLPAPSSNSPLKFNRTAVIRASLLEEFLKVGRKREEGNVRRFWYTNLLHTLTKILGDTEKPKAIMSTLVRCWREMVESGLCHYDGMNIISGKEFLYESHSLHSPYAYIFNFIEKSDYLKPFRWFAKLFGIHIVAPSGQPSRAAMYSTVRNLMLQGVDLSQTFYVLVISDLDPAGMSIQKTMIRHLELALRHYSGKNNPRVEKIRLFVKPDQISKEMIENSAIPYIHMEAKTKEAIKAAKTKYGKFAKEIGGGIYDKNGIPLKIELNAFSEFVMVKKVVTEVLKVIKETSDTSLRMIPEIMSELNKQRELIILDLIEKYTKNFIKPSYGKYLRPFYGLQSDLEVEVSEYMTEIEDTYKKDREKIKEEYEDLIVDLILCYNGLIEEIELEVYNETKDQHQAISTKEFEILQLQQEIKELQQEIKDETPHQQEWLKFLPEQEDILESHLKEQEKKEIKPIKDKFEDEKDFIRDKWHKIKEELGNFREKLLLRFNPVEKELEEQIRNETSEEKELILFEELEYDDDILEELKYLITSPDLAGGTPIKEHPSPVFKNEHSLENAAMTCLKTLGKPDHIPITTIEKFRDGFTSALIEAIHKFIRERLEKVPIEAPIIPVLPDYSKESKKLLEKIKNLCYE